MKKPPENGQSPTQAANSQTESTNQEHREYSLKSLRGARRRPLLHASPEVGTVVAVDPFRPAADADGRAAGDFKPVLGRPMKASPRGAPQEGCGLLDRTTGGRRRCALSSSLSPRFCSPRRPP